MKKISDCGCGSDCDRGECCCESKHGCCGSGGCCDYGERVTPAVKSVVKKPLGKVYAQNGILAMLKRSRINSRKIIAVGDVSGAFLVASGIQLGIWVYDGKEQRKAVTYTLPIPTHIVKNPAGRITLQLREAIDDAISQLAKRKKMSKVFVQGEEDMATLYAIAKARTGTLVIYGQPKKGIVAVKVDAKAQENAEDLLCQLK